MGIVWHSYIFVPSTPTKPATVTAKGYHHPGEGLKYRLECKKNLCNSWAFFLSLDTALPPREDYVQVDCVLKPRYKKCTEKGKIKMIGLKRMYKKN